MHGVDVGVGEIGGGVGAVAVRPDGSDGGVAALGDDAAQGPRVDQVAPEDHVLHHHVGRRRSRSRSSSIRSGLID